MEGSWFLTHLRGRYPATANHFDHSTLACVLAFDQPQAHQAIQVIASDAGRVDVTCRTNFRDRWRETVVVLFKRDNEGIYFLRTWGKSQGTRHRISIQAFTTEALAGRA